MQELPEDLKADKEDSYKAVEGKHTGTQDTAEVVDGRTEVQVLVDNTGDILYEDMVHSDSNS